MSPVVAEIEILVSKSSMGTMHLESVNDGNISRSKGHEPNFTREAAVVVSDQEPERENLQL